MRLFPSDKTLNTWISLVPTEGDLVFFKDREQSLPFQSLGVPLYTRHEVNTQSADLLGLNQRSWYGYSLGNAAFCMKLPPGTIEKMAPALREKLLKIQHQIKVPTILKRTRTKTLFWITAETWKRSAKKTRLDLLKEYYTQNPRIEIYPKISVGTLSPEAKKAFRAFHLEKLVFNFAAHSGPNCFALVAQIISEPKTFLSFNWLHWAPLKRFLVQQKYRRTKTTKVQSGDVLIFMDGRFALHGCVALDSQFVVEKPGQDFYEPYLISSLKSTRKVWRNTQMHIWRKTGPD